MTADLVLGCWLGLDKWVNNPVHEIQTSQCGIHCDRPLMTTRRAAGGCAIRRRSILEQRRTEVARLTIVYVRRTPLHAASLAQHQWTRTPVWRRQVPPAHREQIPPLHRHVPAGRPPADEVHPQAERRHRRTRFRGWTEAGGGARCVGRGRPGCLPSTRWATRMAKKRADKLRMMVVRAEADFKIKATVTRHLLWRSISLLRFATRAWNWVDPNI